MMLLGGRRSCRGLEESCMSWAAVELGTVGSQRESVHADEREEGGLNLTGWGWGGGSGGRKRDRK